MSIEALWAVQFTGVNGVRRATSGGVIVIETGRIFGGDSSMWYTGKYDRVESAKGRFTVRIQTGVHFTEGFQSIFGGALGAQVLLGDIQVAPDQNSMAAMLTVEGNPQMKLTATLTRVAELP
jgi:hypothetical protein